MIEEWRPIRGYVGFYEVSNCGRVRSVDRTLTQIRHGKLCKVRFKGVTMSPSADGPGGYLGVSLCRKNAVEGKKVHILVADAFIREIKDGEEVNHWDFDRQNNHDTNLEITTQLANSLHSTNAGRRAKKLTEQQVIEIKFSEQWGEHKESIAGRFDVSRANINAIVFGKTWQRVNLCEWQTAHD